MGRRLRIYSGGATVTLYDATNGLLALGYTNEEVMIEDEIFEAGLSDQNSVQVSKTIKITARLLQTDGTAIDNVMARRGYLQEVFVIGADSAFKLCDAYVSYSNVRSGKPSEAHYIDLFASRIQQTKSAASDLPETNYAQFIQNILGAFGNCDNDGGGGVATGWTNSGGSSLSIDTSHLGGGYNDEQRVTLSDSGDSIYCRARMPLNETPIKFTVSAYIDNTKSGISYYTIAVRTRNAGGSVLDTKGGTEVELANGANERTTYTIEFTPSAAVQFVELAIIGSDTGSAELGIDNAMLEIGDLTDYVENA